MASNIAGGVAGLFHKQEYNAQRSHTINILQH